ncbi:hypothetical protein [Sphingomonas paucimobilis]|uniref:hypothetical protein n=1 Tax=Sphingomonas paucimobilis TaxID=13689 RepID=UPI003D990E7E
MSIWRIIEDDALSGVLAGIAEAVRQREELTSVIADASADRLANLTPQEKMEAKRKAKAAKQTLQNPRGRKASLAQEEADLTKALNKLLIEHRPDLGNMVKVVVEALILGTQIDEIRKERAEVKAKPKLTRKDSAALKALEDAGCPLWQLARLSKDDLSFVATFVREKLRDPRHQKQDGVGMAAFRAGHLELAVEGLTPDEEMAVLLAAGRISEADIAAKSAFEAAAGRPLQISPTLAGALSRAAERQRSDGVWPGADRTVDHVEEKAFQQDLQSLAEALGGGEAAEERAWDILFPPSRSVDDPSLEDAESIARQMLEHLHGPDQDRWKALMDTIGHDVSMRRAFADRLTETDRDKSGQASWAKTILLAEDWRLALERQHREEVRDLALLVRDRADVRWLAQSRGIDVPLNLTVELPLSRTANLLRQPVTELIWELFDLPPEQQASQPVGSPSGYPASRISSADMLGIDDEDY